MLFLCCIVTVLHFLNLYRFSVCFYGYSAEKEMSENLSLLYVFVIQFTVNILNINQSDTCHDHSLQK